MANLVDETPDTEPTLAEVVAQMQLIERRMAMLVTRLKSHATGINTLSEWYAEATNNSVRAGNEVAGCNARIDKLELELRALQKP